MSHRHRSHQHTPRQKPPSTSLQVPRIAKASAIFQYKSNILQGQFSILSAFAIDNSHQSWHFYCNSLPLPCKCWEDLQQNCRLRRPRTRPGSIKITLLNTKPIIRNTKFIDLNGNRYLNQAGCSSTGRARTTAGGYVLTVRTFSVRRFVELCLPFSTDGPRRLPALEACNQKEIYQSPACIYNQKEIYQS